LVAGVSLIAAALLLWIAWALMPDAATADARHILEAVGANRERVALSAVVQLVASALFAPGVLFAARQGRRVTFWGATLLVIGAMGMAADAVYHQLAVEMTAPGVDGASVLPVMEAMQTRDIRTLAPLLLAFIIGAIVFVVGLSRDQVLGRSAKWFPVAAPLVGIIFGVLASAGVVARRFVALGVLAVLCGTLTHAGVALVRKRGA
jgi:hypothetical protein